MVFTLTMKPNEFWGIVFYTNADILLGLGEEVSSPVPSTNKYNSFKRTFLQHLIFSLNILIAHVVIKASLYIYVSSFRYS
jgi:hypothetical protein